MVKRILALSLVLAMTMGLAACAVQHPPGESPEPQSPVSTQDPADPEPAPPPADHTGPEPNVPDPVPGESEEVKKPKPLPADSTQREPVALTAPALNDSSILTKSAYILDYLDNGENSMLSPLSIITALGMTASGAKGETRAELEAVLGMDSETFDKWVQNLMGGLSENQQTTLELANAIWVKDGVAVPDPDYQNRIETMYQGSIKAAGMGPETAAEINDWVGRKTHNMIQGVVDDISPDIISILVNALYFNGPWTEPYEEYQVSDGTFHGLNGEMPAQLMSSTESAYMENDKAIAFEKYYYDGYSFIGILPKDEGDFCLSSLSLPDLLVSKTYDYDVEAVLPKFEFDTSMALIPALQALGVTVPFDRKEADFTGMFTGLDGHTYIDDIIHKTRIEVSETGTEAAAVTAVMVRNDSLSIPEIKETKQVILDRPFAFIIMDNYNQTPLFIGKVLTV